MLTIIIFKARPDSHYSGLVITICGWRLLVLTVASNTIQVATLAINEHDCRGFVIEQATLKAVQTKTVLFTVVQLFPSLLL